MQGAQVLNSAQAARAAAGRLRSQRRMAAGASPRWVQDSLSVFLFNHPWKYVVTFCFTLQLVSTLSLVHLNDDDRIRALHVLNTLLANQVSQVI